MQNYKCIIFDCDGVLVDSEPLGNQVMVDLANKCGAKIDMEYALTHFKGNSLQKCINHISELINGEIPFNFEEEYRALSFEKFKREIKPISGIKHVLSNLEIPFCVASSGPVNKIKLNLELTGLLSFFQENRIFSCYTIEKWKPDPEVFLWAAKTMGYRSDECLIIEDSPIGIKAANNANIDVFWYNPYNEKQTDVKPTKVFSDMSNLLSLLYN